MSETIPRTRYEALLDVRYQIRLAFLHERLYRRIRTVLAFIALVASSAAFMTALRPWPALLQVAALVITFIGFAELLGNFAEKAARHALWRSRFAGVLACSATAPLDDIERALAEHEGTCDDEIEGLRVVARNDNVRANGHEDWADPETRWQRFMRAIA